MDVQKYNLLDNALMDAAREVKPLFYCNPINEVSQKSQFFHSNTQPRFKYRELSYNPKEVEEKLLSIEVPDDVLGRIFNKKLETTLLENKLISNRGDEDLVREVTSVIHGSPQADLVAYSEDLIKTISNEIEEKVVDSDSIKCSLEKSLLEYGLVDWKLEFSEKRLTTTYPAEKKMTICQNRKFTKTDPQRLAIHEIGVHVLRAVNGYEQPLQIFAVELPGYLPTEEGMTSYFEEITGNSSPEIMRDYAARVIAVDSVCTGLDFKSTFDRVKSFNVTDDQAWNVSVRAHRGGGYIKDHVYLEGYLIVKEFAESGGDFKQLYVGKIGIADLDLIESLEGIIKPPKHLPKFIE